MTEPLASGVGRRFIREAQEEFRQQAQKSLRDQLRKNPHQTGRPPAKSYARPGVRTYGFFCRRHKRLAFQRPRCSSRRPRASVAADQDCSMHKTLKKETTPMHRYQCGSSLGIVEEESRNRSVPAQGVGDLQPRTAGRRWILHTKQECFGSDVSSTPPYYRYHTSDTTHNTHHTTATSHVVAPANPIEDRGGS